jgi:hypothetical protein
MLASLLLMAFVLVLALFLLLLASQLLMSMLQLRGDLAQENFQNTSFLKLAEVFKSSRNFCAILAFLNF